MNDSLVVYIEKDIIDKIDNEAIMKWFHNMKIIITSISCNCYSRESFFCYAYCQE